MASLFIYCTKFLILEVPQGTMVSKVSSSPVGLAFYTVLKFVTKVAAGGLHCAVEEK